MTPAAAPSGEQFSLAAAGHRATVVEVGGGLRTLDLTGLSVLDGYAETEQCTGARGLPLIPWPNRIADGSYRYAGVDHQLPITEPGRQTAIHGLLRWRNWRPRVRSADRVVLGTVLRPMMGFPFTLDVAVDYRLDSDGLTVTTVARNLGAHTCPYGAGQHPYLTLGAPSVDAYELTVAAATAITTDTRGLPTGSVPVAGTALDFGAGRLIGAQDVDTAFTDLARDTAGRAWAHLGGPGGRRVSLWVDPAYPFVQIYTAHTQDGPAFRRGLAVEPTTCAPDAFRSGHGLIHLAPGATHTATWGLTDR